MHTLLNMKELYTMKRRKLADMSIEQAVMDYATAPSATEEPLMFQYTRRVGNADEPEGEEVNMRTEFARYMPKLKSTPLGLKDGNTKLKLWSEDDARKVKQAFQKCRDEVVAQSPFLIATVTTCQARDLARFGEKPVTGDRKDKDIRGIWFILDEAPAVPEPSALIPLTVPSWAPQICGMVQCGDLAQLPPFGIGNYFNIFYSQLENSMYKRLVTLGMKEYAFTQQKRIHPQILSQANRTYYNNTLSSDESFTWPKLPKGLVEVAGQCFGASTLPTHTQVRHIYVEVNDAQMRISTQSQSKANYETFYLILHWITLLRKVYSKKMHEKLAIICPYRRQIELYRKAFFGLLNGDWSEEELPTLWTVDGAQGQEISHVIIDMVVVDHNGLGFLKDIRRQCVMLTRAKHVQWIVGPALDQASFRPDKDIPITEDPETAMAKKKSLVNFKNSLAQNGQLVQPGGIRKPTYEEIALDLLTDSDKNPEVVAAHAAAAHAAVDAAAATGADSGGFIPSTTNNWAGDAGAGFTSRWRLG
jgi:hypothetical protein